LDIAREFDLIMTIVNRGYADQVVDAARSAGAHGGTVFYARGTGVQEVEKFFAISIHPEKEVVINLVRHE
jgi:nitrogen regulatory protein P-II 1